MGPAPEDRRNASAKHNRWTLETPPSTDGRDDLIAYRSALKEWAEAHEILVIDDPTAKGLLKTDRMRAITAEGQHTGPALRKADALPLKKLTIDKLFAAIDTETKISPMLREFEALQNLLPISRAPG